MSRLLKVIVWLIVLLVIGGIVAGGIIIFGETSISKVFNKAVEIGHGQLPTSDARKQAIARNDFVALWSADFKGNRVIGFNKAGEKKKEFNMASAPLTARSFNTATEYVTVSPSGSLIVSDGEGMMVQEIDRNTGALLWQFGVKDLQGFDDGLLHQPDKSFKINDHEVLINDGNNRRVIIIDQRTDEIVWQYGETMKMGSTPGLLRGNTNTVPINGGEQILITDTLDKRILIVDRATKQIVWQWSKPDAKWLQHVWPTQEETYVMEDRQQHEVFEVDRQGNILWTLNKLSDGSNLRYPTDVIKLGNGNVLIAEAGRGRIIEVVPQTGVVVQTYEGAGFVTTIAIDNMPIN